MLPPNLDPGSSGVEIVQAAENAILTGRFFSAQSIALWPFWSRGNVVVDPGNALLDNATIDGKSVPLEE